MNASLRSNPPLACRTGFSSEEGTIGFTLMGADDHLILPAQLSDLWILNTKSATTSIA